MNISLEKYKSFTDDEQAEFLRALVGDLLSEYVDLERHEAALDDVLEWIKEFK